LLKIRILAAQIDYALSLTAVKESSMNFKKLKLKKTRIMALSNDIEALPLEATTQVVGGFMTTKCDTKDTIDSVGTDPDVTMQDCS
jgi:hypothetical protein